MDRSPPVSIPRLETPRLRLREYRAADFDAFAQHVANPDDAVRFIGSSDRKTAWRMFGCQIGCWVLQGAGWWAVEQKETGEVVGTVGAFFREGWPAVIELGWNTYRAYWGRGFASEAAAGAARYALEERGEDRVTALIDPRNVASIKVAERIGLRHEADTELWGTPVGQYVRRR